MNKFLPSLLSALLVVSVVGVGLMPDREARANATAQKVRAIDLDQVIQKSSKAQELTKEFQRFQKKKQDELRKEQETLEKEQRRLNPNSPKEELNAYAQKVQATARKLQEAELETQQRFQKTRMQLLEALKPTFEAFAREHGIGILLDSNTGGAVYVDPAWDHTKDILPRIK